MDLEEDLDNYYLKRERLDISSEIKLRPAPTIVKLVPPFYLRVVDPESKDPELISAWMNLPHLKTTWEQPWSAQKWKLDSELRLRGSYSVPYILSLDSSFINSDLFGINDIGYLEIYWVAKDECSYIYDIDPWDIGMHIAIGDINLVGKGMISQPLIDLKNAIFAGETKCKKIIADPDYRNLAVRKFLEKNNFNFQGEFQVRVDRKIALYFLTRN